MNKSIEQINYKIKKGNVNVVTADEMTKIVKEFGSDKASEKVDVVTTGTFGAMCSSGVWFNFGHSEPPIKMAKVFINGVEAYTGVAAVDAYLGAGQLSKDYGINYGGAHVIEDLLKGKRVILQAISYGTDCYPLKELETEISLEDLNQAIMLNPRNAYQKYDAATNSTNKIIYTYMGKLLPKFSNITFSGAGELSPLMNDPEYETIGIGTRIFLGGAEGYIIGNGTQHNPKSYFGTLMVKGDLREMSTDFLRAAVFKNYGPTLYVGIGVPIPILNAQIAKNTGISDNEIITNIVDYGTSSRERPIVKKVSYKKLKSGYVDLNGKRVKSSSLSSFYMAKKIAITLEKLIEDKKFYLTEPVENLPTNTSCNFMKRISPSFEKPNPFDYERKIDKYLNYDEKRCIKCGACISICPFSVFQWKNDGTLRVNFSLCKKCGLCEDVCHVAAININKKKK